MGEQITIVDIVEIARRYVKNWEVRTRRDGSKSEYPMWSTDEFLSAIHELEDATVKGSTIELRGNSPTWVMASVVRLAYPNDVIFWRDELYAVRMVKILMAEKCGDTNPDAEIDFSVSTDGDKVFITYMTDDMSKPFTNGSHNYNLEKLPLVITPYVDPNSHVYLQGSAAYPVSMSILSSYFNKCKSISIMDYDQPFFTCVASYCDERNVGDQIPGNRNS